MREHRNALPPPPLDDADELPAVLSAPPPSTARAFGVMERITILRLARNVRSLRIQRGLSIEEAAASLGRGVNLWQAIEACEIQLTAVTAATLVGVACVLRVGLEYLVSDHPKA